ncbi:MAG: gliding motility-associated C-terminal domain-containing protein [Prevotellaceae bacterium]|jgi:fibronectin type 3 domain-containing protein|nr:gliding motility-associated C-terminal domain-containing protein [Prevotellaceae bacterium]
MKNAVRIILISVLMIAAITVANSQCLPPPPIVESVSVVPNTNGDVNIRWHGNPDDTCTTTGYEIYKHNYLTQQFDFLVLVSAGTTDYTDINAGANIRPQIYRMTTKAGPAGNEHSENHHSVFLNPVIQYDPCELTATVLWTPYKTSYRDRFEIRASDKQFNDLVKYQIVGYIAPAASPFNLLNTTALSPVTGDTIINFTMIVNQNYLFCVKAYLPNGEVSYSNVREGMISGSIPVAPQYIKLDSLVSFDTHNHLHFEIENSTEMTKFQIERCERLDSAFKAIHTFSDKNTTVYDDNTCDVNKKYFYRITAFNNIQHCIEAPAVISDTLNSITLNAKYTKPYISVSWNDFIRDSVYYLYRNGLFWLILDVTQFADMDIQNDFGNNIYDFCYKIVAVDRITNYTSISREYCRSLDKPVTMPNAIDPTSAFSNNIETHRRRNQFAPIVGGKETDYEYNMIIFNRWNTVLFETTKPMDVPMSNEHFWNGTSARGNVLPEDTYLYYVKITFKNSNQVFEQKGTVSLIYQ